MAAPLRVSAATAAATASSSARRAAVALLCSRSTSSVQTAAAAFLLPSGSSTAPASTPASCSLFSHCFFFSRCLCSPHSPPKAVATYATAAAAASTAAAEAAGKLVGARFFGAGLRPHAASPPPRCFFSCASSSSSSSTAAAAPTKKPGISSTGGAEKKPSQQQQPSHVDEKDLTSGRRAEHMSLEGRYAAALLRAAKQQNLLGAVHGDTMSLKEMLEQSDDFIRFIETPVLSAAEKQTVLQQISTAFTLQPLVCNLLLSLLENKRLHLLRRVVEAFDLLYKRECGEVQCIITSSQALSQQQQKEVVAAVQKRAGPRAKLVVEYATDPQLLGGLVVRLGEQVLDFSVATRIDRLHAQLLAPF